MASSPVSSSSGSSSSSFPVSTSVDIDSHSASTLGDDGKFDNAPEKPNVAVVDNETSANQGVLVDGVSVTEPSKKSIEDSSNVEKKGVSRLSVTIPESIMTLKRVISRRFLAVSGESLASPLGEEVYGKDVGGATKLVSDKSLLLQSTVVLPLAKVSKDSDEDSGLDRIQVGESLEDLSAVKDSRRVEEVGEEEDKLQLGSSEHLNGSVKGDGPHAATDEEAAYLVESEVSLSSDSLGLDDIAKYSVEEIQELENMEQVPKSYDTDGKNSSHNVSVECTPATRTEDAVDSIQSKEVVEGSQTEDAETDELTSVIYFPIESDFPEADEVVGSTVEANVVTTVDGIYSVSEENAEADQDLNVDAVSVANTNCETNVSQVNKSEHFILESKSENAESLMEQHTDFCSGQVPRSSDEKFMEEVLCSKSNDIHQLGSLGFDSDHIEVESKNVVACDLVRSNKEEEGSCSEDHVEDLTLNTVENNPSMMELVFASDSLSGGESSRDHSKMIDEHFVTYLDEDVYPIGENEGELLFDYASFTALSYAARGSETDDSIAVTFADDLRNASHEHSADLNSSISSTELTAQTDHPILSTSTNFESKKNISAEENRKFDVQHLKVRFLRLVQMLGLSSEETITSQILNQLDLAVEKSSNVGFCQETDKGASVADYKKDLDFSLNILVIGKSGVGKSATINSIFGEEKTTVDPFKPATTAVKEIVGTIDGIKVRVLDTPGLRSSLKDQSVNRKILKSIRRFTKTCPPDVVIYVDRLDIQSRDFNDLPMLKSITSSLGSSLWQKSLIILTHATSITPDGPSGEPLSFETLVSLQTHVIRQLMTNAIGDQNMVDVSYVIPVCLVENHRLCKKSIDGQALLPNGKSWKPQLLLLCYSVKILSELNATVKAYITLDDNKLLDILVPSPPLPYLSSMLQSHDHPKFYVDQGVKNLETYIDIESLSCSHQEDEEDYNQLPSFKPLIKSQIANLSKEQTKAVIEEYEYRIKKSKQWRKEIKRLQKTKKTAHDNPNYWCRFLEDPTSHLLAIPLLDTLHSDHDLSFDRLQANPFQFETIAQIKKEGEKFDVYVESILSAKNSENGSTTAGLNIKTIGEHHACILKGKNNMNDLRRKKTAFGASITLSEENVVSGIKFVDEVAFGKRLVFAGSLGAIQSQDNAAYGANFEVHLGGNEYALEQEDQTTMNLSLMRLRGDLIWGCSIQSKYSLAQNTKMAIHAGINNKKTGQVSLKVSGAEQFQIALVGLLPIACNIFSRFFHHMNKDC